MSEWTQAAGSAYLTAVSVQSEPRGVLNAKVVRTDYDTFEGVRKPIVEVEFKGGRAKVALNATNMAVIGKWLNGRSESALVGKTLVLGTDPNVKNPRTGVSGPAIRVREVRG